MNVYPDEIEFLARDRKKFPERAIIAFTRKELAILRQMLPGGEKESALAGGFTQVTRWPNLILAGPVLGAPQAAMVMEIMGHRGVNRFFSLGWCGSLTPDLVWGDIVLPDTALSEEGVSMHYPCEHGPPTADPELVGRLEQALVSGGVAYTKGRVWTTDAPYRETREKVRKYAENGVLAVDMESSALMAVARFRGLSWAGLMVVSDELFGESGGPDSNPKNLPKDYTRAQKPC